MLTMMRNMLRSKAAGGLFVILIIAMAAWGVTDIFAGGSGSGIISSGDRSVTDRQFDAAVERVLINAQDAQGRSLTKEQALEQGIIDQVFQRKQSEVVVTAYADQLGMSATKAAIDDDIRRNPVFQDATGLYSSERYLQVLRSNSIRPDDYRSDVEIDLTLSRLRELPIAALKAPRTLARLQASYDGELRNAQYFTLRESELAEIGEPSEEDLTALYDARQNALREPERRAISLLRMSTDDFIGTAEVPEADIEATYEAFKAARYAGPDTRRYTILSFADETSARAALGRIAGGAAAESIELAISSETREGLRETLSNARLQDQVFAQNAQAGSIHGPQLEAGNYLVVRLEEITPGAATPLDEVRDDIRDELARAQAANIFYDLLPQLDDLLGTGAALEEIAEALGVPLLSFDAVDQTGRAANGRLYAPLTEAPDLLAAAFNQPVGNQTERFNGNEVIWLGRVDSIVPESMPEFADVAERLRDDWRREEAASQLQRVAGEVEAAIADSRLTFEAAAEQYNAQIETLPRAISRGQAGRVRLPNQLLNALFSANNVDEVYSAPGLPSQYIIMQITEIDRPETETIDLLAENSVSNIQEALAEDLYTAYFLALQTEVDLNINAGAYEAYKQSLRIQP